MKTLYEAARDTLIVIESIASGSTTANSLPNLARIAREGLVAIETAFNAQHVSAPSAQEAMPEIWKLAMAEVEKATRKFPTWPTDPLHAVAVLGEEFGELTKAVLQATYEPHKVQDGELRTEAIQTAAMALRFLASLDSYEFARCAQHVQATPPTPTGAAKADGAEAKGDGRG